MSKKLLLADDSITIQKVIQITFAHENYELTITDNGDTAFEKAKALRPDLVMADVYMPGKNGYELCSAIKQDPALKDVPVLLLAGSFEPFDENKARAAQAEAWIEKPFESQLLLDKVAELLSAVPAAAAPVVPAPEVPAPAVAETAMPEEAMAAPMDDPFGDISFEEEVELPAAEPVAAPAAADDWSDFSAVPEVPAAAEPEPAIEDFGFEVEEPAGADDFTFEAEEPAVGLATPAEEETFVFAEEAEAEALPEVDFDSFAESEDEIMALDEGDILGAEELEPLPEEPTLAAWSRSAAETEPLVEAAEEPAGLDVFAEPVAEIPAGEPEPEFAAEFEVELEPEPEPEPEPVAAEVALVEVAPEPVAPVAPVLPATAAEVETRVGGLSEAELEKIIEKVVGQLVEKLAGTILEKVAWEVVPDLAENLIKAEIRKIKEQAA